MVSGSVAANATINHRLLYRGALELPDSYILLDGLSFTLQVGTKDQHPKSSPSMDLLQNPLALALESMRGRTSLQFLGVTQVKDVFVDSSCYANVYIHPKSTLTRIYFENMLCLFPITSVDGKTDYGLRVGLGDQDVPGSSEILIYGHLPPDSFGELQCPPPELQLFAARIVPAPPPSFRLPRPDDPTPRKPPLIIFGEKQTGKAKKSKDETAIKHARHARHVFNVPKSASSIEGSSRAGSKHPFKVPDVPHKRNRKHGNTSNVSGPCSVSKASQRKEQDGTPEELEKMNKAEVKKSAVRYLEKHGVNKEHQDFKDLFGFVYRGASFALRLHMASTIIDSDVINELVKMHVQIYVRGDGVPVKLP